MLEHELERLKEAIALEDSGQGAPSSALALAQPAAPSKVCQHGEMLLEVSLCVVGRGWNADHVQDLPSLGGVKGLVSSGRVGKHGRCGFSQGMGAGVRRQGRIDRTVAAIG